MREAERYRELGSLTTSKDKWAENIPYVSSLLNHAGVKIQAKALWLLREMGLAHPLKIKDAVPAIASFCDSTEPVLRERAANALGRTGRADFCLIEPYWAGLFRFLADKEARVRLIFVWASEHSHEHSRRVRGSHGRFRENPV